MSAIHDMLLKAIDGEIDEKFTPEWVQVQKSANTFLEAINTYKNQSLQIKKKKNQLKSIKMKNSQSGAATIATIRKLNASFNLQEQNNLKRLYNELFKFDAILNRYLGETLKRSGVYVDISADGTTLQTYVLSMSELVDSIDYEGKIHNTFGAKSTIEQLAKNDVEDSQHIAAGTAVVSEIIARLNNFYDRVNQLKSQAGSYKTREGEWKELSTQRQGGLLLWQQGDSWKAATVANFGVISEAYVNFLFTKHNSQQDILCNAGGSIDDKIDLFYNNYLQSVTTQSALIEEDVIVDGIGQYAVKKEKATLPQISQYEKTARQIKNNKAISPEGLKDWIKQQFDKQAKLAPIKGVAPGGDFFHSIPDSYIGTKGGQINVGKLMREAAMQTIAETLSG